MHRTEVENKQTEEQANIYFAQIRAFLSDQYGEKSAVITWLIPCSDEQCKMHNISDFDPTCFSLGPAEEFPRSLDMLEFVCRPENLPVNSLNSDYDYLNQYKCDLLRHKFDLEDLAESNFRIVTTKTGSNDSAKHECMFN